MIDSRNVLSKEGESAFEREKIYTGSPDNEKLLYDFERTEDRLRRERTTETRLFAIDAGLEHGTRQAQPGSGIDARTLASLCRGSGRS